MGIIYWIIDIFTSLLGYTLGFVYGITYSLMAIFNPIMSALVMIVLSLVVLGIIYLLVRNGLSYVVSSIVNPLGRIKYNYDAKKDQEEKDRIRREKWGVTDEDVKRHKEMNK